MNKIWLLLVCLLSLLWGCSTGTAINTNLVNQIQNGVTTEWQIRQWFGEPVSLDYDKKRRLRVLRYYYENTDELKRQTATVAAAAAGGALGSQIGGGSGRVVAGSIGAIAAGSVANNLVTARQEEQNLIVYINSDNSTVVDHDFYETKSRTQKKSFNQGVSPL